MRSHSAGCVFLAGFSLFAVALAGPAAAQAPAPASPARSAPPLAPAAGTAPTAGVPVPAAKAAPPPEPGPDVPGQGGQAGGQGDIAAVIIDVPSRHVAQLVAKAKWEDAFKVIKETEQRVRAAADKAGLKPAGAPLAVFTREDDNGFTFTAMLPLAPDAAAKLGDGVAFGQSPPGKAIKFQHRGPYDDIDETYDLITAYLDEKGLEAQDFFIEEYLTPLTSAENPYLGVDIYVFLK